MLGSKYLLTSASFVQVPTVEHNISLSVITENYQIVDSVTVWNASVHSWWSLMSHFLHWRSLFLWQTSQRRCVSLLARRWLMPSFLTASGTRPLSGFGRHSGWPTGACSHLRNNKMLSYRKETALQGAL